MLSREEMTQASNVISIIKRNFNNTNSMTVQAILRFFGYNVDLTELDFEFARKGCTTEESYKKYVDSVSRKTVWLHFTSMSDTIKFIKLCKLQIVNLDGLKVAIEGTTKEIEDCICNNSITCTYVPAK